MDNDHFESELEKLDRIVKEDRFTSNYSISSVAHNRPKFAAHPPLMCRHIVVFFPYDPMCPEQNTKRPGDFEGGGKRAKEAVKLICNSIIEEMINSSDLEQHNGKAIKIWNELNKSVSDDIEKEQSTRFRAGTINGFCLRVKADIYKEFFSVTFFLDNPKDYLFINSENNREVSLTKLLDHWKAWISERTSVALEDINSLELLHSYLWKAFDNHFGLCKQWKNMTNKKTPMDMIGDFRGLVLCCGEAKSSNAKHKTPIQVDPVCRSLPHPGIRLFKGEKVPPDPLIYFNEDENRLAFLKAMGLDKSGSFLNEGMEAQRTEANVVLCRMLNDNAVYGSALGNQSLKALQSNKDYNELISIVGDNVDWLPSPALLRDDTQLVPTTYFVIYNGRSAQQIGRLIHRLHVLGEIRTAALLDYKTMNSVGVHIRDLGEQIAIALASPKKITNRIVRRIIAIYAEIGNNCHGGVAYRASRCQDYVNMLDLHLNDTGTEPIDGWQSYTNFINRNLSREFQSITTTGKRYEDLGVRVDRLVSVSQSERSIALSITAFILAFSISVIYPITEIILKWAYAGLATKIPFTSFYVVNSAGSTTESSLIKIFSIVFVAFIFAISTFNLAAKIRSEVGDVIFTLKGKIFKLLANK